VRGGRRAGWPRRGRAPASPSSSRARRCGWGPAGTRLPPRPASAPAPRRRRLAPVYAAVCMYVVY
jgi:hypothetical protein